MRRTILFIGMTCCLSMQFMGPARAASSLTDPLTSFDAGNFTIASPTPGDAVVYDASGTHFGTIVPGDSGRNYQRTLASDYATVPFVAEITFELSSAINDNGTPNDPLDDFPVGDNQAVFFGLGAGNVGLFGVPDWDTPFSSASFLPETGAEKFLQFTNRSDGANSTQTFFDVFFSPFDPGVHRFRMEFNPTTMLLTGALDINYAGGPFVADVTALPDRHVAAVFARWLAERSITNLVWWRRRRGFSRSGDQGHPRTGVMGTHFVGHDIYGRRHSQEEARSHAGCHWHCLCSQLPHDSGKTSGTASHSPQPHATSSRHVLLL